MKDLKKANKLLENITEKNKYITPVSSKDYSLFRSFFDKEPHTYGNSWVYITQGVYGIGPNNLGYKYFDGVNLSLVCIYPKIEQENIDVFYWIRPMGPQILDIIDENAKKLLENLSIPTYVKKISKEQYEYLHKKGFKDTSGFPWHNSCPSEDDTYPEQIYDIKATYSLLTSPPRTSNIRKSYRRSKKIEKINRLTVSDKDFKKHAWKVTNDFFNSEYIKQKKLNISNKYDYYNCIFECSSRKDISKNIFFIDNLPVGYYIGEKNNNDYTSVYALISLRDKINYLSDYMMFYLLENCKTPYLNIGGSEDAGIDKFKKKFKPVRENKMYWAAYF